MIKNQDNNKRRKHRHKRVRSKIYGTQIKPRLNVYRSLNNITAQIIDDINGHTIIAATSLTKNFPLKNKGNIEAAKLVGKKIAELALAQGINGVVFDRGGYLYHGRIKALADSARANGLNF